MSESSRRDVLVAAFGATCAAAWLSAFEAAAAPLTYHLEPKRLVDGIWMIEGVQDAITMANGGAIANVVIIDSKAGAIIVDTGPSLRYGTALAALARQLTGKDIARVYNTHFHPDHVFGNQAFDAKLIAAPQGVIDDLKVTGDAFADSMYRTTGDWMRGTELRVPGTALTAEVEDFGDRRLRPLVMRGHTACDLALFEETSGFLLTGDLVFLDRAPTTPHADIERWRINLSNLGGIPRSLLVPGHGPADDGDRGINQTREWLETIYAIIKDAFDKGLDITEAIKLPLPAWTEKIAVARYEFERSVMHIYPKLEAEQLPALDKKA